MRIVAAVILISAVVLAAQSVVAGNDDDTMDSVIWGEWFGDGAMATIDAYGMVTMRSNDSRSPGSIARERPLIV